MPNRNVEFTGEVDLEIVCFPPEDRVGPTGAGEEASPGQLQAETARYGEAAADDPSEVFSNEEETNEQQPVTAGPPLSASGAAFLHERNPKLHASREVEDVVAYLRANNENIPNEPNAKVTAYLGFLASPEYVNDGTLTGEPDSLERRVEAHVIKEEDIPESYFDLQRRIAREHGFGDQEITPDLRHELTAALQADQKTSLNTWAEYLSSEDGAYPDWFKCYAWEGVVKMGSYDQEKEAFQKRSRGTVAPYPELDREALAYVHDTLHKTRVQGEPIDNGERDSELQKHLTSGNFANLYAYAISEVSADMAELHKETEGSWATFRQSDDPEAAGKLANSLQGYGTGWCTAGEATAQRQLREGDFYIYRTRDSEGEDTVPRVAIRMQNGEVAEVRGIKADQELEPALADITAQKLQDLPGSEAYTQKAEDMKRLTAIEREVTANPNVALGRDDVRLLYETDHVVRGFGYVRDPRLQEIRQLREGRDKPELANLAAEMVKEQAEAACKIYYGMASALDLRIGYNTLIPLREVNRLLEEKDAEWREKGLYDYLADQLSSDGGQFVLTATPNVVVDGKMLVKLAHLATKGVSRSPEIQQDLFEKAQYSAAQLSGVSGDSPVRFGLIPTQPDSRFSRLAVPRRQEVLRELQADNPEINMRVPSVLDAITYWHRLSARGEDLHAFPIQAQTEILHFDLEPVETKAGMMMPESIINNGHGSLYGVSVNYTWYKARLIVG